MFSEDKVIEIAHSLNVDFNDFSKEEFLVGVKIELEHGHLYQNTNVTNDDLEKTIKIALAHLNRFPNYYNLEYGLPAFLKMLKTKMKKD